MLNLKRYPGESVILTAENFYLKIIYVESEEVRVVAQGPKPGHITKIQKYEFWNENQLLWRISGKEISLDFYYKKKHVKCYLIWNSHTCCVNMSFDGDRDIEINREEIYDAKYGNKQKAFQ